MFLLAACSRFLSFCPSIHPTASLVKKGNPGSGKFGGTLMKSALGSDGLKIRFWCFPPQRAATPPRTAKKTDDALSHAALHRGSGPR